MTTYTTPHFATGTSDRNVRPEPALNRARPAAAAPYRTAGVSNEAALMAAVHTPEWQPGAAKRGVPKAVIGALGVALIGGAALAIVLLSPSDKVTKQVLPDPIAQAAAQNTAAQKSVDSSAAAVDQLNNNPPAAGDASSTQQPAAATAAPAPAVPAPVQAAIPDAPPVVNAPVARVHHTPAPAAPRVVPQPVQQSAPAVTPDTPAAPVVTPPADVQPPAMQQTPDTPTVTPSAPTPAPTPDTPAPTPAPAQSE